MKIRLLPTDRHDEATCRFFCSFANARNKNVHLGYYSEATER